ncbi:MAG: hypothetical protein KAR55_04010 [Thermoplasmatales archaeon]|nr:hypothetical protein [Thermoplasmatales archaeon]
MSKQKLLDWEKVVDGGFGDKHNMCIWSMRKFNDYLYAGTMNFTNGCQIYRSQNGDKGTWEQVSPNGFKDNSSTGIRNMIVYNNLLWVVTFSTRTGTQIWVTNGDETDRDGMLIWKKANIDGFGEGKKIHSVRSTVVYKNKLYVGTQVRRGIPRIYRYDGPTELDKIEPNSWSWINEDWGKKIQNIPKFSVIGELLNFKTPDGKEYVYAGVYAEIAGQIGHLKRIVNPIILIKIINFFTFLRCRIWRYDGEKWEKISRPGFGKPNILTISSAALNDSIYFGTTNIFGAEIWKTIDGSNWVQVMKRGFGYPINLSVYSLHNFENRLIVGMQNQWLGCQIWASTKENPVSNKDFIKISRTAFDEKFHINPLELKQDGIRVFETFNDQLYAGTASNINIFKSNSIGPGCQVWRINQLE